jgi:hypothetical protein
MLLHEQFIVDEKGKKKAAVLPYAEWKRIAAILEEYEDIVAYDKAKTRASARRPLAWKAAIKKLKSSRS